MSERSSIQWTTHTFNIAWGCIEASAGCDHCYARGTAKRYGYDVWGKGKARRVMSDEYWAKPLKWNARAERNGRRDRVFCSSMTDVFLNDPIIDREREKLWPLIIMTPYLDWQILTKHPERFAAQLPDVLTPNVWLGVSVEDQTATWRIPYLRKTNAPRKFLSVEPMLGPIAGDIYSGIDWIIVGGESTPKHRPMDLAWARAIRNGCRATDTAFFFKQVSAVHPTDDMIPKDLLIREYPEAA